MMNMPLKAILFSLSFVAGSCCIFYSAAFAAEPEQSAAAVVELQKYLAEPDRAPLAGRRFAGTPLTKEDAAKAKELLWQHHLAEIRRTRSEEMKARVITQGDLKMPFYYTVTGEKPAGGRSLYISLHGGGGAPAAVNDSQWENQKRLYKPAEGVYLVPRAPTNTWNLWHQGHIDAMFDRLIENLVAFEEVNPNRVYVHGYSAGGDGVYQLAPRMADRFAAAAMMAGHPNETSPLGLRNLPFTIHVGADDTAYKRNEIAAQWKTKLEDLRKNDPGGYENWVKLYEGKGHWLNLEDAAALPWMAKFNRNPLPDKIVWKQDDVTGERFYWLALPQGKASGGSLISALREGQSFTLESDDVAEIILLLNDDLADLDQPITISAGGKQLYEGTPKRTITQLADSLAQRGDPDLMFSSKVQVQLGE